MIKLEFSYNLAVIIINYIGYMCILLYSDITYK